MEEASHLPRRLAGLLTLCTVLAMTALAGGDSSADERESSSRTEVGLKQLGEDIEKAMRKVHVIVNGGVTDDFTFRFQRQVDVVIRSSYAIRAALRDNDKEVAEELEREMQAIRVLPPNDDNVTSQINLCTRLTYACSDAVTVALRKMGAIPVLPGESWSVEHNNTSCQWNKYEHLGRGPDGGLGACKAACVEKSECKFINWFMNSEYGRLSGVCELYSGCANPWCRSTAKPGAWWSAWQLTTRHSHAFPPCANAPPPPKRPTPPSNASWFPSVQGWTGKIKVDYMFTAYNQEETRARHWLEAALPLMKKENVVSYSWDIAVLPHHHGNAGIGSGDAGGEAALLHAMEYKPSHSFISNKTLRLQRDMVGANALFTQYVIATDNPANEDFWLHDTHTHARCVTDSSWSPRAMGPQGHPFWNFTNTGAGDWWVDKVIGELTADERLTNNAPSAAVLFEGADRLFCGTKGQSSSDNCNFSSFDHAALQRSSIAVLARMVRKLNAAGITPILSLQNSLAASCDGFGSSPHSVPCGARDRCAVAEDELLLALKGTTWVRYYAEWAVDSHNWAGTDLAPVMIQNAISEGEAGVPSILSVGWIVPDGGCTNPTPLNISRPGRLGGRLQFAIASYLIVASGGTLVEVYNPVDMSGTPFCWPPEFDLDYGVPLGPAKRTGSHSWARNFTRCQVAIDVRDGNVGHVHLLA